MRKELARLSLMSKYGPPQHVNLVGLPQDLAIRRSGQAAGKYYFAVPITDVLQCALAGTDQSSLLVRGMSLDFDMFHSCDVELDMVMVSVPAGKGMPPVCSDPTGRQFSAVDLGIKTEEGPSVCREDLLSADDPVISTLLETAFGVPGGDGTYFKSALDTSMKTFRGLYSVNQRLAPHKGRVRNTYSNRAGLSEKMGGIHAKKQSFHF